MNIELAQAILIVVMIFAIWVGGVLAVAFYTSGQGEDWWDRLRR